MLERQLRTVPGVIDVTGYGGTVKQYQVLLDTQLMRRYDVTLQMVSDAISQSNANVGGDVLPLGPQSHNVRAIGYLGEGRDSLDPAVAENAYAIEIEKLEDIQDVVVTTYQNMPVYVKQIAKVVIGYQPRLGIVGRNDENDVVEGIVLMRKYEKSLITSQKVLEKIDEINKSSLLPKGMRIKIFNQRTELVNTTTYNVIHNLVVGMALVVLILFIFLGDVTSAGIVALMIPLALLFSMSSLYVQGKSANLLSIGAVDFGIIVDSSVIIVENIYRHITARDADRSRPLIERIDRGVARNRAGALFLDADHRLRIHSALLHDGSRRGALRAHGQHLCLRHLRRTASGGDVDSGALLLLVREQAGGEGHDCRPNHEAALLDHARPCAEASISGPECDGGVAGLHNCADPNAGG